MFSSCCILWAAEAVVKITIFFSIKAGTEAEKQPNAPEKYRVKSRSCSKSVPLLLILQSVLSHPSSCSRCCLRSRPLLHPPPAPKIWRAAIYPFHSSTGVRSRAGPIYGWLPRYTYYFLQMFSIILSKHKKVCICRHVKRYEKISVVFFFSSEMQDKCSVPITK